MIRPVEFNGMIQNTHAVADLKANEESKPALQQQNALNVVQEQERAATRTVQDMEDAQQHEYDYSRGGGGQQGGQQKRKKKSSSEEEENPDGIVRVKGRHASFDIKI